MLYIKSGAVWLNILFTLNGVRNDNASVIASDVPATLSLARRAGAKTFPGPDLPRYITWQNDMHGDLERD